MGKPFIIGVTGGSGSGKTHFLKQLEASLPEGMLCVISQDHYYKPIEQQIIDKQGVHHFDLPEAIDREKFHDDVVRLKHGETIHKKEYTFNNPHATPTFITFKPAPVIVVEGLFVQYFEEVANELDLKIFIEAKTHLKPTRRIIRDNDERGYDLNDVLYRFQHHVMPVYESLISPLKDTADLIIPNNKSFENALKIVTWAIRYRLTQTAE
ncbi:uridine kinase family protein [Pseudochryseolinea flava]|uniref:Uridine kinase n=1 Tax=Pseudochryseolinea flava TaxID=2059302 RepID=A0A364Y8U7_9BACT|nr:P-loop NTPase fold protein [Pseudochryseolinea flava]RAW02789.1 uridine kinase [Pseudochryseolinea flava]